MKSYTFSDITVRPFPTLADLNNPWIIGGVQVIINVSERDYSAEEKRILDSKGKVLLHCTCGNNRSRTVVELFHYLKTGEQIEDEYKGYTNHLLYNIGEGHLPMTLQ